MDQQYKLYNKTTNELIKEGDGYAIREAAENLLLDKIGFWAILNHTTEDDNVNPFLLFLYSGNLNDLSDGELNDLASNSLDIHATELEQHESICEYLDIYVVEV